ncbi:MAG: lactate utilization protein [Rhizobiales bacterium]|nr:lactate utilization protein [Hyphomicrobiales bacterium]
MADPAKRDAILARMRQSLSVGADDEVRRKTVKDRIKAHKPNLVPARAQLPHKKQVELFREQAEAVQSTVTSVARDDDVPAAVADYLRSQNLPQTVRHGDDPLINKLPWRKKAPTLELNKGIADPQDEVSLSHATVGVAETGTLVLTSGSDNPTTLNFLPENHIVVIKAGEIRGTYEDAWQHLRKRDGERTLPRTVNMVTGPSRTGDIEQRIELGAHGPRRLHIIIIGG